MDLRVIDDMIERKKTEILTLVEARRLLGGDSIHVGEIVKFGSVDELTNTDPSVAMESTAKGAGDYKPKKRVVTPEMRAHLSQVMKAKHAAKVAGANHVKRGHGKPARKLSEASRKKLSRAQKLVWRNRRRDAGSF